MSAESQLTTIAYKPRDLSRDEVPERYRVREDGLLVCSEAPTLRVSVERGGTVSASALRNAPEGSIYVDGAAQGAPVVDIERSVINLDHHDACVRPFTLSACEQALVLVAKGFDLQSRDWKVHANEPDLDTLLALWVLLNQRRIQNGPAHVLERLIPLVRLEGAIDVHGLEHRSLAGLPPNLEDETMKRLESIRELEVRLKELGEWSTANWAEYVRDRLGLIDRLIYRASDFLGHTDIEELARAELSGQGLAIACRSEAEIYVVEEKLREIYGTRLGIILLEKDSGVYTLRQARVFSRYSLDRVYDRLNLLDPAAGNSRSAHRWGGSTDIGGSPRGTETALTVEEILAACRDVSSPLPSGALAKEASTSLAVVGAVCALGFSAGHLAALWLSSSAALAVASVFMALLSAALLVARRPRHDRPAGGAWAIGALVAAVGAAAGGAWAVEGPGLSWTLVGASLAFALSAELLFRGVCFGSMLRLVAGHARRRRAPLLVSTLLYVLATAAAMIWLPGWQTARWLPDAPAGLELAATLLASGVVGAALGWIRQASESLVPSVAVHLILALALSVL